MASVFSKIIQGEFPSYKIYENDFVYAFLALDQIRPGHTLIVPKTEVDHFIDVPEPFFSEVFKASKIIGKALYKATGCKRVGTIIAGWDVPHFHYHIVPMYDPSDIDFSKAKRLAAEAMTDLQKNIVSKLEYY